MTLSILDCRFDWGQEILRAMAGFFFDNQSEDSEADLTIPPNEW